MACCCGCPGCCMPVDEFGDPVDIPFSISAPGCTIDGFTGVFTPLAIEGSPTACGICGVWGYTTALDVPGEFWMPDGIGGCALAPGCIQSFCMILKCSADHAEADDTGQNACCRRLRLQISASYAWAGSVYGSGTGSCVGLDNVKEVPPDSCDCDTDVSAVFSFDLTPLNESDPDCGNVPPCVLECAAEIQVTI